MKWKIKLTVFCLLAIPAFSGYPLNQFNESIPPGIPLSWIAYLLIVHIAVMALLGNKPYRIATGIALFITLPVVILGSGISAIGLLWRGWQMDGLNPIMSHYSSLAITMITVIPLALCMVAMIPFHRIESRLLQKNQGVTLAEKCALMFVRVFIHIVFFVIPEILEVLREEKIFSNITDPDIKIRGRAQGFVSRGRILIGILIQIGVEGICSAIRYIPLWAEEISRLPGKQIPKRDEGSKG